MRGILDGIETLNGYLIGAVVPIVLMLAGLGYLFYLRAFHLRHPVQMLRAMLFPRKTVRDGVSPFRAVTLALAGTLGVGNLVGVAGAIALGGPGAVFWMLLSAFLAMLLKYAEIVLALLHRRETNGVRCGGAMYYMREGLAREGLPRLGALLAAVFAVLSIVDSFTMGSVIQMNAVGRAFHGIFGFDPIPAGAVLACLTLAVTLGGGRRISALTERLVPLMTLLYLILSVAVLILRFDRLPFAFRLVMDGAFSVNGAASGIGGFLFSRAVRYGTMRGLMSNEAGCGTAPIAHAESSSTDPAEQGVWGIFEVFVDTILLCTLTASVILVSYGEVISCGEDGMMMTVRAYSVVLGAWCEPILAVLVLFFAFATVICWTHYGRTALGYFSGQKALHFIYTVLMAIAVFIGTVVSPAAAWTVSDLALGIMTLLNVTVLWKMRGEVRRETERYFLHSGNGR